MKELIKYTFNKNAEIYNEIRPGYPEELIRDIIEISQIPQSGKIIEVGCGTGQATIQFAKNNFNMICIDIGENLTKIAKKNCEDYPKVQIKTASFENIIIEENTFDLLISATAFHWIPPELGYPKAAKILNNNGSIAIFRNNHPKPYTDFFEEVQTIYNEVVPEWNVAKKIAKKKSIPELIKETNLFQEVVKKEYRWEKRYRAEEYIKLLNTYSDHIDLEDSKKKKLYKDIYNLIVKNYNGSVIRPYISVLFMAKKK